MIKLKKLFFWLVGIFIVLLLAVNYLLPKLINSELLKGKIENIVSQKVGGNVQFHNIDLSIFPLPHAVIHNGAISKERIRGTIESLSVYPEILPLFIGELRITKILVKSPDIKISLPVDKKSGKSWKREGNISPEAITNFLAPLALDLPSLEVVLEDGNFNLLKENKTVFASEGFDVRIVFPATGLGAIKADVDIAALKLTAQQGNSELAIQASGLKGSFYHDEDKTSVSLSKLNFDYPQLRMTGELSMDRESQQVSLALEGKEVDVHSMREVALALAGKIPVTQKIFKIVKGGKIPEISFHSKGKSFAELDNSENFIIRGNMNEGKIFVPGAQLDLDDVNGDVVMSGGILEGKNLEARLENAQGREGVLKIGLTGKDAPFHLDMALDVDLSQLPPLLKRLVKNEAFAKEINLTHYVKGKARGRLILGESLKSIHARIDISELKLSADYERIPYSLVINNGKFYYDKTRVGVKNLSGNMGKSSFSGLTAQIGLNKEPYLEILSGKSIIIIDEIYPWLSSFERLGRGLKGVKGENGTVELSSLNLKGPLLRPEDWHFETQGDLKNLLINASRFPGPVEVKQGKFRADKKMLSLMDARIDCLDASFHASGNLEKLGKSALTFSGTIGPEAVKWLSDFINLPAELHVRSPLALSQASLVWEKEGRTSFKGNFSFQKGADVLLDILRSPEEIMIKNLYIKDHDSKATLALNIKKKAIDFKFDGNLTGSTLDKIFIREVAVSRWIQGKFNAHILVDQPMHSSFQGKLEAKDVIFPWGLKVPLTINSVSLNAKNNNIKVDSADLTLGNSHLSLKGDIIASEKAFLLDMNISADTIAWDTVRKAIGKEQEDEDTESFRGVPLQGMLRVKSDSFTFNRFTWNPFHADISFNRNTADITVTNADLCSISTPGVLKVTPQNLSLNFQPAAKNQELEPATACLFDIRRYMTGKFDLEGNIKSEGKSEEFVHSLRGNLEFHAQKGRIYQYGLLSKILAFLNLTEIFRGRFPDLVNEGFAYKTISAKADIQGSKLFLKEFIIDGSSMQIAAQGTIGFIDKKVDLKVLVAPLKTADFIIKKTPLIKDILGGTLVSIPVEVKGDFENPDISYLSASGIGSGLMGIMTNILKAPMKIIQPVIPGKKEEIE